MAASHNPNPDDGNNSRNFEAFIAVAVTTYVSDEDHIMSFKVGQEMLIIGEVAREAGQFWYKGKVDLGEEEEKFIHKASVVKKIPLVDPKNSDGPSRNREEDHLKLKKLLQTVNLDVDVWMRVFEIERIRSVEDLEFVLIHEGENGELTSQMKVAEQSKFNTIKESGEKKVKLREWISNAGLDTEIWFSIMAKNGITSVSDLVAVSNASSSKIIKAARNSREEAAVGRLLRLDLSGGAGGMTECLKGCGMRLPVEDLGGHTCLEVLRARLDRLTEIVEPLAPSAKFLELGPCFDDRYRPSNMLNDNIREYYLDNGICSHWLTPNDYKGPGFTYELSLAAHITGFSLRNTASAQGNDRGTDEYKLLTSMDGHDFTEVHSGNLPDARNKFGTTPCVKVELEQSVLAKFVRFDIVSFYGVGAGLHYFKAHCDMSR